MEELMRIAFTFLWVMAACASLLRAATPSTAPVELTAAVQAIQQSADPSAAVAAFANGVSVDRNSAAVYEAYIARMIEFGLPEMAYRQAWSLTSLVSSNGLAWGVLAYVDARRGDMTNAVAALKLAAQFAPDHPFVQRTAGELLAWYDLQPGGAQLSPELGTRFRCDPRPLAEPPRVHDRLRHR